MRKLSEISRATSKFLSQSICCQGLIDCQKHSENFLRPFSKILSQLKFHHQFVDEGPLSFRIFEILSKILSQFPFWEYDRAVVTPTYSIGAGIRSNIVPTLLFIFIFLIVSFFHNWMMMKMNDNNNEWMRYKQTLLRLIMQIWKHNVYFPLFFCLRT